MLYTRVHLVCPLLESLSSFRVSFIGGFTVNTSAFIVSWFHVSWLHVQCITVHSPIPHVVEAMIHAPSGSSAADGYLDEHLNISKLMSEYAENDKHYDGVVGPVCVTTPQGPRPILQEGPPRPILRW